MQVKQIRFRHYEIGGVHETDQLRKPVDSNSSRWVTRYDSRGVIYTEASGRHFYCVRSRTSMYHEEVHRSIKIGLESIDRADNGRDVV